MTETQKDYAKLIEEMHQTKLVLAGIIGNLSVQVDACRNAREFDYQNLVVAALDDANAKLIKLVYAK
jgi:hypothetical protein